MKYIPYIILAVFISFLLFENHSLRNEANSNYILLTDSVNIYKNKVSELYKEKESYIVDNKTLKNINQDLYNEIKHLKDNPIVVTKTEVRYEIKEIFIKDDSVKVDSTNNIIKNYYNYKDDYFHANIIHSLNIVNNKGEIFLNNISATSNLYLDIIERNKKPFIIARADNPYLEISNVDGGFVNFENSKVLNNYYKRQNRWNFGVNMGVFTIYNINTNKIEAGPGFGISVGYSFAQW